MAFAKHTDKLQKFLLFVADSKPHRALSFDVTQCLYNRSAGRRFLLNTEYLISTCLSNRNLSKLLVNFLIEVWPITKGRLL